MAEVAAVVRRMPLSADKSLLASLHLHKEKAPEALRASVINCDN
jgi:hypothetical protein